MRLGLEHILDLNGYDHILFVLTLCLAYPAREWKKVAWLLTAFTAGHSISLGVATLNLFNYPQAVVEASIAGTILLTAVFNLAQPPPANRMVRSESSWWRYPLALVFGLIHGLGFSSYLRSLLGAEESLAEPLIGFNIGLEAGQLVIVLIWFILLNFIVQLTPVKMRSFFTGASGFAAGMALALLLQRL